MVQVRISQVESNFNELTAIYWAWKNDQSDVKGLVHYRDIYQASQ
ncbi:DUF4422 domain-containing protein [Lactiplantibacillus plantarum]|nr:DUF4422 domain-containing protein [Lactiplantibacillus plantarum]